MIGAEPSRTAMMAAAARAAHPLVDHEPYLFRDTMAAALLGPRAEELIGYHLRHGAHPLLAAVRAQATVRSHWAETRVAESGAAQYVILGAGLDSFAYRSPVAQRIRVFEVDHPETQRWKREILAINDIAPLGESAFVPVDFERDDLTARLAESGFDASRPSVIGWLGVSMYLTADAIAGTLAALAELAPGTELVMEYMLDPALRDTNGHAYADSVQPVTAEQGEPWLSTFTPAGLDDLLRDHGFTETRHITHRDCVPENWWDRTDALQPVDLCRLVHAKIGNR